MRPSLLPALAGLMSSGLSPHSGRLRRWPQEGWEAVQKRRPPSQGSLSVPAEVKMKLREEISARESLQDFCFVLAERVGDLEREVQRQAETIALLTNGGARPCAPAQDVGFIGVHARQLCTLEGLDDEASPGSGGGLISQVMPQQLEVTTVLDVRYGDVGSVEFLCTAGAYKNTTDVSYNGCTDHGPPRAPRPSWAPCPPPASSAATGGRPWSR